MDLLSGVSQLFSSGAVLAVVAGALLGLVIGALPGLTSTMALAVLAPLTFGFDTHLAVAVLIGVYVGGIAGGSIPAICLNIPGTPASAATAIDGYHLARQGRQQEALKAGLISSGVATALSCLVLVTVAPTVAAFGLRFSAPEYFALGLVGLVIVISVSGSKLLKGIASGLLGLLFAFVGIDAVSGTSRFTFGTSELASGLQFVPAIIGVFGMAEVLNQLGKSRTAFKVPVETGADPAATKTPWRALVPTQLRASGIGTAIGSIPGAGADIASWVSYDVNSKFAKKGDRWGRGEIKGVVASEAGNNANVGGAMIPMVTFGIPGDGQTAMLIAFLLIHGLNPGPGLISESPDVVYGLFASVIIAGLFIAFGAPLFAKAAGKIVAIPTQYIYPVIVVLCVVGAFAVSSNPFSVVVMVFFGVLGWLMIRGGYPVAPLVLGMILGPLIETNLRRGLVLSGNDFWSFFERPIVLGILGVGLALLVATLMLRRKNTLVEEEPKIDHSPI